MHALVGRHLVGVLWFLAGDSLQRRPVGIGGRVGRARETRETGDQAKGDEEFFHEGAG